MLIAVLRLHWVSSAAGPCPATCDNRKVGGSHSDQSEDLKPAFEPGASIAHPLLQCLAAQTLWRSHDSRAITPSLNIPSEELKGPGSAFP